MDLALRFSTCCATAYPRDGDRTRRLFNAAVLDEVHVRDGHVVEAAYKEPFDLPLSPRSNTTMWWALRDSNPRPAGCKPAALAT